MDPHHHHHHHAMARVSPSPSSPFKSSSAPSDLPSSWAPMDDHDHDDDPLLLLHHEGSEMEEGERGTSSDEDDGGLVEEEDHFDRLPDSVLLLVFNRIGDVKDLGRCSAVSHRFRALVPLVDNVLVRIDCIISGDDHHFPTNPNSPVNPSPSCHSAAAASAKPRGGLFSHLALVLGGIVRPLQAISQIFASPSIPSTARPSSLSSSPTPSSSAASEVSHHLPTEVLRNLREIRRLRIGELGVDDGVLLKWMDGFGSTLDTCVILGANSVLPSSVAAPASLAAMGCSVSVKGPSAQRRWW